MTLSLTDTIRSCPTCHGRGVVAKGFYNPYPFFTASDTTPDDCRTCGGTGAIEVVRLGVGDHTTIRKVVQL